MIQRFIDQDAQFFFVPDAEVKKFAERENATAFDVDGVELGHDGAHCSFDAIIKKYGLTDPALRKLAKIVRGADTADRQLTPESAGLHAIAAGFHALWSTVYPDDHALLAVEFPLYDALYEYCLRSATK